MPAFGATWPGVGYYELHTDKVDTFQVVLIDRSDTGAGHFDVEFNYGTILWESGDRSDGSVDGVGGSPSAIVGYSDGVDASFFPGSGIPGAFLDSNPATGLIHGPAQGGVLGRYTFEFREDLVPGPEDASVVGDAGALDATVGASTAASSPTPADPPPSALGCACKLTANRTDDGGTRVTLLTCAMSALVLCRRRR
jgi:hypothetical protein